MTKYYMFVKFLFNGSIIDQVSWLIQMVFYCMAVLFLPSLNYKIAISICLSFIITLFINFFTLKKNQRILLMTTKGSKSYTNFNFKNDDTLLFGRESAGVPDHIHSLIEHKLKIPMAGNKRSLNIASSVAIILSENIRQTSIIK
mgnify:CR=1 FL=1